MTGPALAAAGMLLAWLPLLFGAGHGFYLDDLSWLESACRTPGWIEALRTPWRTGEVRPVAQVLFFLEQRAFGLNAPAFNGVSLLLHALVVALVIRLARALGAGPGTAWSAGILFAAGCGHLNKPVAWACAQGQIVATAAALAALTPVLRSPARPLRPAATAGVAAGLAFAVLAHEQAVVAPVALVALVWFRRHPSRRALTAAALAVLALYTLGSARAHSQHHFLERLGVGVPERLLTYPAAFLLPVQAFEVVARRFEGSGVAAALRAAARVLPLMLGAATIAAGVLAARRLPASLRDGAAVGLLLLGVALSLPLPSGWVEARHFYPAAAFLAPAIAATLAWGVTGRGPAGLAREAKAPAAEAPATKSPAEEGMGGNVPAAEAPAAEARGRRRSPPRGRRRARLVRWAVLSLLALWAGGILAGSVYMQRHAADLARDPAALQRLDRVRSVCQD